MGCCSLRGAGYLCVGAAGIAYPGVTRPPVATTIRGHGVDATPGAALELPALASAQAASGVEVRFSRGLGGDWNRRDYGRPLAAAGAPVALAEASRAGAAGELALFVPDRPAAGGAATAYVVLTVMADGGPVSAPAGAGPSDSPFGVFRARKRSPRRVRAISGRAALSRSSTSDGGSGRRSAPDPPSLRPKMGETSVQSEVSASGASSPGVYGCPPLPASTAGEERWASPRARPPP